MSKLTFTFRLTRQGIGDLKKLLQKHRSTLESRFQTFLEELAKIGTTEAQNRIRGTEGEQYIHISHKIEREGDALKLTITAKGDNVYKQWYFYETLVGYEINELLLEEFGSGRYAENPLGIEGVGRGSTKGMNPIHPDFSWGEEENDMLIPWKWRYPENEIHRSVGHEPSAPMYNADLKILDEIDRVVRKVFGSRKWI